MRALASAIATFVLPGFGQAIARRPRAAIAWSLGVLVLHALVFASPWAFYGAFAARFAAAVHAAACAKRGEPFEWLAPLAIASAVLAIGTFVGLRWVFAGHRTSSSSMVPTLAIGDDIFIDTITPHFRPIARGEPIVFADPCNTGEDMVKRVVAVGGDTVEVRCNVLYVNGEAAPSTLVEQRVSYREHTRRGWDDSFASRYRERLGGREYDIFHDVQRPLRDSLGAPVGDAHDFPRAQLKVLPTCGDVMHAATPPRGKLIEGQPGAGSCDPQLSYLVPPDALFVMGDNRGSSLDSRQWGPVPTSLVKGRVIGIWLSMGEAGASWARVGRVH